MFSLSIIIVNFEKPEYTLGCVQSIYDSRPTVSFEIILIDNGSKDGSLQRIREQAPVVIGIKTGENLGFTIANNLGINNARSPKRCSLRRVEML